MTKEKQRLEALLAYQIMDTGPEPEFDSLTDLASQICETPISLVSLVDDKRQWFKSRQGLDAEETPKEIAFCSHAIEQEGVYEVPNASEDKLFSENPLVTNDPNIRFYAGAPLRTPNGHNIGTLCVIDQKPKTLSGYQKKALRILAEQVMAQLELKRKNHDLASALVDLKKHQDSLVQTEKLASLGRMAGGIAHELNNPLQVLNNYMELISVRSRKIGHKEEFADIVKNSKNTIFRMARIIQTMLGFVKSRRNSSIEDISLLAVIDDTLMLLSEKLANYSGEYKTLWNIDNQLKIQCNPVEISQVLINLISNAMDASLKNKDPKVELIIQQTDGGKLDFTVTDNGEGIPDDILAKVSEPFFTTKEVGQGTGLGLFIGYQVAERMGGSLEYKREQHLTLFSLLLPFKAC